jgi:hypothetical protein
VLIAILLGLLVVGSVVAFVVALRLSQRRGGGLVPRPGEARAAGLDRLEVGGEVTYDDQRWLVRGVQHVTPSDGPPWSAWHLDDRGQGAWLVTHGDDADVLFAVRAERPETLDPGLRRLRWRDHEWVRVTADSSPVRALGERRARRGEALPVSPADLERRIFVREEMPSRKLVLERSVGEGWNAWIGPSVPAQVIDVWPPPGAGGDAVAG